MTISQLLHAARSSGDTEITDNLRSIGLPTGWDQVSGVALTGVIVSLAAMLIGSLGGAILGERWHTLDPPFPVHRARGHRNPW